MKLCSIWRIVNLYVWAPQSLQEARMRQLYPLPTLYFSVNITMSDMAFAQNGGTPMIHQNSSVIYHNNFVNLQHSWYILKLWYNKIILINQNVVQLYLIYHWKVYNISQNYTNKSQYKKGTPFWGTQTHCLSKPKKECPLRTSKVEIYTNVGNKLITERH